MKVTKMPMVSACAVHDCAYNGHGNCHARAITVGDGAHPRCDTFVVAAAHSNPNTPVAGVGACKVVACSLNSDLECRAQSIRVGYHERHADCLTFTKG